MLMGMFGNDGAGMLCHKTILTFLQDQNIFKFLDGALRTHKLILAADIRIDTLILIVIISFLFHKIPFDSKYLKKE